MSAYPEHEAVAEVIYAELVSLNLKTRPWSDLTPFERGGWMTLSRKVIATYEAMVRKG